MSTEQDRTERFAWMKEANMLPFDLDFLRALGFGFGEDWDGEVLIDIPLSVDMDAMAKLVRQFTSGIKKRLYFERIKAQRVCCGGPKNGVSVPYVVKSPLLFHVRRGEWLVYAEREHNDPRFWFVGTATNRRDARLMECKKYPQ